MTSASEYHNKYQSDPWTMNRARAMQTQSIGLPGLATGNPIVDMMFSAMLGNNVTPQASQVQSQLEALTIRRRSLEGFNRIAMQGYSNNAVSNNFGGFAGVLPYGAMMADQATGGIGSGVVSRLLSPILGGSPILAEQKLYAGLNGMTRNAAFGLRGETSIGETSRMMRGMEGWFYNQTRNNEDFDSFAASRKVDGAGLRKHIVGKTGTELDLAIKEYLDGADEKLIDEFKKRARTTKYGNIDFTKTYGYNMEDVTGAFSALGQHGLLASRGSSAAAIFSRFGSEGGMGTIRAAQNLFGSSSASDAVRDMNSFLGVSSFNAADAKDRGRFETMAHKFEAASLSTGIEKGDLLQLVEAIREISKQARHGMAIGGMEAGNMALRAVAGTQAMLVSDKTGSMQDYLRRNGGIGGLTQTTATQIANLTASAPSSELHGLMGAVDRFMTDGPQKEAAKQSIINQIEAIKQNPALANAANSIAFKNQLAKQTGMSLGSMGLDISNQVNVARGLAVLQKTYDGNYDPSAVSSAMVFNQVAKWGRSKGIDGATMDDIVGSSSNPEEAIAKLRRLKPGLGISENDGAYGTFIVSNWAGLRGASTKGKASIAEEIKTNTLMGNLSKDLEGALAGARTSITGAFGRSLLSGEAVKNGLIDGVLKERILAQPEKYGLAAANFVNNFTGKSDYGDLLGQGGIGGVLSGLSSDQINAVANGVDIGNAPEAIKNVHAKLTALLKTGTPQQRVEAQRGLAALSSKDGKFTKSKFQRWIGQQIHGVLAPELLKNEEVSGIMKQAQDNVDIALGKYASSDIAVQIAKRDASGKIVVDKDGNPVTERVTYKKSDLSKMTAAQLSELDSGSNDPAAKALLGHLINFRKTAETVAGDAMDETAAELPDVMQKLIDSIGGEGGGLIKTINELISCVNNVGTTGATVKST